MNAAASCSIHDLDLEFIRGLVAKGGPSCEDYSQWDAWIEKICQLVECGRITKSQMERIRAEFKDAWSSRTLQGFAFAKPHGYAGDFEIIDRIYTEFVTPVPKLRAWDSDFQRHAAQRAIRNRKRYFIDLIHAHSHPPPRKLKVLNFASGPGRDMLEYFQSNGASITEFDCIEQDPKAIGYASALCAPYRQSIQFSQSDPLHFRARQQYDLVWSAGVFDSLDDRRVQLLLNRLIHAVKPGGELVAGNFAPNDSSRRYMEFLDWAVHYRTAADLAALAESCGVPESSISIREEPEGINLFLHIRKSCDPKGLSLRCSSGH